MATTATVASWSSVEVANTICAIHGHNIATVGTSTGEATRCHKCGLSLAEIRSGKKEN